MIIKGSQQYTCNYVGERMGRVWETSQEARESEEHWRMCRQELLWVGRKMASTKLNMLVMLSTPDSFCSPIPQVAITANFRLSWHAPLFFQACVPFPLPTQSERERSGISDGVARSALMTFFPKFGLFTDNYFCVCVCVYSRGSLEMQWWRRCRKNNY